MARRRTPAAGAPQGSAHPRALFAAADIIEIHRLAAQGWSQREIATQMTEALVERGNRSEDEPAVRHTTIGKILREERYRDE